MLKRLLLSTVILSVVSVSSYAVDVNIPGARILVFLRMCMYRGYIVLKRLRMLMM